MICNKCKIEKPLDSFYDTKVYYKDYRGWPNYKSNYRRKTCKDCDNSSSKETYKRRIKEFYDFKKTLKCEVCEDSRYYVLQFHHLDPTKKDYTISKSSKRFNISKIKEELEKCKVLCANCHLELHHELKNNLKES